MASVVSLSVRLRRHERRALARAAEESLEEADPVLFDCNVAKVEEVRRTCEALGAKFLMVVHPRATELLDGAVHTVAQNMMAECRARGIEVIDAFEALHPDGNAPLTTAYVPRADCHPNAWGHARIAEAVSRVIATW